MEESGVIRCILTIDKPGTQQKCHLIVFILLHNVDKIYYIRNWPEHLQDQLDEDLDINQKTDLNYDVEISLALNA